MKLLRINTFSLLFMLLSMMSAQAAGVDEDTCCLKNVTRVFQINLMQDVDSRSWIELRQGVSKAEEAGADILLLHLNTYGGEVLYADSMRTCLLNATPVTVAFIDNNAASAGALISIACDSIYMRSSAMIGASTVVNQTGEAAPDKYQSYMRAMIRATAESKGQDTVDGVAVWRRNPRIAEAMVDPDVMVAGVIDSGKVLTFTAHEAIEHGFCEALAEDIPEILTKHFQLKEYVVEEYVPSGKDKLKGSLMGTALRAALIMVIVAGIWFELQSPGMGFPSIAAFLAAVLYFAPLYIDGLVDYWEIIVFVAGAILLFVEIIVTPGFGVLGILGIIGIVTGLTFSLVDSVSFQWGEMTLGGFDEALLIVVGSILLAVALCLWLTSKIGKGKSSFRKVALDATQDGKDGFVGVPADELSKKIGAEGVAVTILRPAGKVRIDGSQYDAVALYGYIEEGTAVKVIKDEAGQLYVTRIDRTL